MCFTNETQSLHKIFCDVQENKLAIPDYLKWLQDYCDDVGFDNFCDEFLHVLLYLQMQSDFRTVNPYYHNIFQLWTRFVNTLEEKKEAFKLYLVDGFLKHSGHSNEILRFRVCESLHAIFNSDLTFLDTLSEELLEKLRNCMLSRIHDVNVAVTVKSIEVIKFLQNVDDINDPVIAELTKHVTNVNVKIRLAVLDAIAPLPQTIPTLIKRIRDVNEKVRIATCKKFSTIPAQNLTIVQRRTLVRNGFKDFSSVVRKSIEEDVLPWWLKSYNNNYIDFMLALSLDGNDEDIKETKTTTEEALHILFRCQSVANMLHHLKLNNNKLIETEELTWTKVMYWRNLVQHFSNESKGQYLEQILPGTTEFSTYLTRYYSDMKNKEMKKWENKQFQLTLEELVRIATFCDIMDECSRQTLHSTLLQILAGDVSENVISVIFIYIKKIMPDINKRITFICEFISEIKNSCETDASDDYLENEIQMKHIRNEINKLSHELKNAINELNFQKADVLKTEIENLKKQLAERNDKMNTEEQTTRNNDPKTILKCANIVIELLQAPEILKLDNSLKTLRDELVKDLLFVNDPFIQSRIMKCYAILCTFEKKTSISCAKLFVPILVSYRDKTSEVDENILVEAIGGIADMMLMWGEEIFPDDQINTSETLETVFTSISYNECVQIIISLMDDKHVPISYISGIVVTKLLDLNRIESPLLVSRLILKWFNPVTAEKQNKFHQYLGVFLVNFNQETHAFNQFVEAFIPTLITTIMAPANSPLTSVPIDKLTRFLVHVTSPETTKNHDLHRNIALLLLEEIENNEYNTKCNIIFSKAILYLDISISDQDLLQTFIEKSEDVISILDENYGSLAIKRNIQKFIYQLTCSTGGKFQNELSSEDDNSSNRNI